jgi:hypothetical protein
VVCVQNPLTSFAEDVAAAKRLIDAQDGSVLLARIPMAALSAPRPVTIRKWRAMASCSSRRNVSSRILRLTSRQSTVSTSPVWTWRSRVRPECPPIRRMQRRLFDE